jgi:hypothetical protein
MRSQIRTPSIVTKARDNIHYGTGATADSEAPGGIPLVPLKYKIGLVVITVLRGAIYFFNSFSSGNLL